MYGLTGGIGSGKSTVSKILKEHGCIIIDADQISREVTAKDMPLLRVLVRYFGPCIIKQDGELDRKKLAEIAFNNKEKYVTLNRLVQTAVHIKAAELIHKYQMEENPAPAFFDVPLLFEAGWNTMVDKVWTVSSEESIRIRRVMERDGLSEAAVKGRLEHQLTDEERESRADIVIKNNGTFEELTAEVLKALKAEGIE